MACNHKFLGDLGLKNLEFSPTVLIIGTFNPKWPKENTADWFYGRVENNNFWYVLPKIYGAESLKSGTKKDWKEFCKKHKIAITDLIESIADADENNVDDIELLGSYSDKAIASSFSGHKFVDILSILSRHPSIEHVYLTRGDNPKFWKDLWKPVESYCRQQNISAKTLLTPSGYAYYQQGKYNKKNPDAKLSLENYILKRWKEEWHF